MVPWEREQEKELIKEEVREKIRKKFENISVTDLIMISEFIYYYRFKIPIDTALEYRTKTDSIHERDIFCWFDLGTDRKKFKKLLENYGFTFIFDDEEDGFWITGVKE